MRPIEIINAGTSRVRNDAALNAEYKKQFEEQFGYEPECPTCGSTRDWNLFKSFAYGNTSTIQNTTTMSDKTFKLRDIHAIYTYKNIDDKTKVSRPVRTYGHLMTEDFAKKYLTVGTSDELKARRAEFAVLPAEFLEAKDEETETDLSKLTVAKLQELATEKEYPSEEWKNLKKDELVVYLEAKDEETEN